MSDMLSRWAEKLNDRTAIEEFLDWCEEQNIELRYDRTEPVVESRRTMLNRYHGIDERQLDDERRELIRVARNLGE